MTRRKERWTRYGLGSPGPEITWRKGKPPRRKREERPKQRPAMPDTGQLCTSPSCPDKPASAAPGRYLCKRCIERLEARADELKRRAA